MGRFVLMAFDAVGWLLSMLGIDRRQFRAILELKLTLDERRPITGVQTHHTGKSNRSFLLALIALAFFGLFLGLFLFWVDIPLSGMTVVFTFVMTMVGLTLIADFTNVLVDTTDNAVLLPRPVGGRTIFAARAAHIISYLGLLALSLSLCTIVSGAFAYHPLFPLLYLPMLACALVLVVFAVYVFFFVTLRLVDVERFRDIILYFQIVMTVAIFGGYQLFPRMMNMTDLRTLTIDDQWWIYLYPPSWMAAPFDLLAGRTGSIQWFLSLLGLLVPLVCLIIVVRVLAPGFNTALAKLESGSPGRGRAPHPAGNRPSLACRLSRALVRRPAEQAPFELIWQIASRDRPYKLATYPMVAFVLLGAGVFILSESGGVKEAFEELHLTRKHLFPLYFICALAPLTIQHLRYSDQHEAAWIYHALPLDRPGSMLSAALQVVLLRFIIPMYAVIALATLVIWGVKIIPDILLAFLVLLFFTLLYALCFGMRFPFSEGRSGQQSSGQVVRVLLFMGLVTGLGFLHLGLTYIPFGVLMAILVALALDLLCFRWYRNTSWMKLKRSRLLG